MGVLRAAGNIARSLREIGCAACAGPRACRRKATIFDIARRASRLHCSTNQISRSCSCRRSPVSMRRIALVALVLAAAGCGDREGQGPAGAPGVDLAAKTVSIGILNDESGP